MPDEVITEEVISLLRLHATFQNAEYYGRNDREDLIADVAAEHYASDGRADHIFHAAVDYGAKDSSGDRVDKFIVDGGNCRDGDQLAQEDESLPSIAKEPNLSFIATGPNLQPNLESSLQGISLEPTAEVLQLLAKSIDTLNSGNIEAADILSEKVFAKFNEDIGGDSHAMGLSSLAEASRYSHCTWGDTHLCENKSIGGIKGKGLLKSRSQSRRISVALDALLTLFEAAQAEIEKGEGSNLPNNYIDSDGRRVFEISHVVLHNTFIRRVWCQKRLSKAIIALIDVQSRRNLAINSKLEVLRANLLKQERSPTLEFDITAENFVAPIEVLASLYMPGIHAGSNALVSYVNLIGNPLIVDDEAILCSFISKFTLRDDIPPWTYFKKLSSEAKALPLPNADIDWTAAGLPLDLSGRFIAVSDTNIANSIVRNLKQRFSQSEFSGALLFFTPDIFARANRGLISVHEFKLLCKLLDDYHICHTRTAEATRASQDSGATADSTITRRGGDPADDCDMFVVGNGISSSEPLLCGHIVSDKEKDAVYFYGRVVALLGNNFERLIEIAELLNYYFASVKGSEAFRRKKGEIKVPLVLEPYFSWIASSNDLNYNCRRDIYAAFQLLRDLMMPVKKGKVKVLSKIGAFHAEKQSERIAKLPQEFMSIYIPNTSAVPLALQQVIIRGETVKELTI